MTPPRRATDDDTADAVAVLRAYEEFPSGGYPPFITRHIGRIKAGPGLLPSYLNIVPGAVVSPAVALCKTLFPGALGPMGLLKYHYFRFVHKPVLNITDLAKSVMSVGMEERIRSIASREYLKRMCSFPPLSVAHQAIEGAKLLSVNHIAPLAILFYYKATQHALQRVETQAETIGEAKAESKAETKAETKASVKEPLTQKFSNSSRTLSTGARVEGIDEFTGHVVASCAVSLGGLSRLLIAAADGKCAEIVGTRVRTQFQLQPVDTYVSKLEMTGPKELSWWAPDKNSVILSADPKTNELLFSSRD